MARGRFGSEAVREGRGAAASGRARDSLLAAWWASTFRHTGATALRWRSAVPLRLRGAEGSRVLMLGDGVGLGPAPPLRALPLDAAPQPSRTASQSCCPPASQPRNPLESGSPPCMQTFGMLVLRPASPDTTYAQLTRARRLQPSRPESGRVGRGAASRDRAQTQAARRGPSPVVQLQHARSFRSAQAERNSGASAERRRAPIAGGHWPTTPPRRSMGTGSRRGAATRPPRLGAKTSPERVVQASGIGEM
jgi:hypothetical protein